MAVATKTAEILVTSILGFGTLFAMSLFNLIWTYLSKKPLGMQTYFDQVIKDLLVTSILCTWTSSLTTLGWGPFDLWPDLALVYMYVQLFTGMAMFTQMMMAVLVRYLFVFHSTVINSVDEKTCKIAFRLANFLLSAGCSTYEILFNDFRKGLTYHQLTGIRNDDIKPVSTITVNIIIVGNLVAIGLMHAKIEWSKHKAKVQEMEYSFWTLRSVVSLLFVCGILQVLWFLGFFLDDDEYHANYAYNKLRFHTMMMVFLFNFIPVILILRNHKIAEFAFNNYFKVGPLFRRNLAVAPA